MGNDALKHFLIISDYFSYKQSTSDYLARFRFKKRLNYAYSKRVIGAMWTIRLGEYDNSLVIMHEELGLILCLACSTVDELPTRKLHWKE